MRKRLDKPELENNKEKKKIYIQGWSFPKVQDKTENADEAALPHEYF